MIYKNKTNFLLIYCGLFNTVIGYFSLIYLDYLFNINIFFTALISRFFSIFLALINYKLIVFKTRWEFFYQEFIKIYFVYTVSTFFYVILIFFLHEILNINLYLAQIFGIMLNFLIVNKTHINYTFNTKKILSYATFKKFK